MKKNIHPAYYPDAQVTCACGNKFTTGSTVKEIHVEICSACHPFYTGKQKFVDTAHRVDRFKQLRQKSQAIRTSKKKKPTNKKTEEAKPNNTKDKN